MLFALQSFIHCLIFFVVVLHSHPVGTTCEHLGFSVALHMPTLVVVTKVDLCPAAQVEHTVHQLEQLLTSPGCSKVPFRISSESDVCTAAQAFNDNR